MSHYTGGVKNRRRRVISRMEIQLESGMKIVRFDNLLQEVALTDKDKERIQKEISTLKTRI